MSPTVPPTPPARKLPDAAWEHYGLYCAVREALATLPIYFRTETHIAGVMATDLYTLNSVLGATIEEQVVRTLNLIRSTWDSSGKYALYSFVRQPQTFPDVRLRKATGDDTILGLELKGWYLLAKETEPSLRFQTTASACAEQDLIVVVPWVLSNVISGAPMLFEPWIESARYAAEFRNYHWQHLRQAASDTAIVVPSGIGPYPVKADQIGDRPASDVGGNFGRLARTGIMEEYIRKLDEISLCGIKAEFWRQFLKSFQESTTDAQARAAIERLRKRVLADGTPSARSESALRILVELETLLNE